MSFRPRLCAIFLPLLLTCCAHNQPVIEPAPTPAIVRPPCSPPPNLMAPGAALSDLAGDHLTEQRAVAAWVDDMTAYQMLRTQLGKLQAFITTSCQ